MIALSLLLALHQNQEQPLFKPIDLFRQIIGVRTGRNGYEEYLLAAEALHNAKFEDAYRVMLKVSLGSDNWLSSREALTRESGATRQLITEGNAKSVQDPRIPSLDTLYPDLSYLKMVARYLPVQATVEFSQGQNQRAGDTLLAGLVYADKLSRTGVLITYLVAQANVSLTLLGYQDNLERLSLSSWASVIKHCDFALSNSRIVDVVSRELEFTESALDVYLNKPERITEGFELATDETDIAGQIKRLSVPQRLQVKAKFVDHLTSYKRGLAELVTEEEGTWGAREAALQRTIDLEQDSILSHLLAYTLPSFVGVIQAELKYRAQMRLLRLHGLIQTHRWTTGQLPTTLDQLGRESACQDPLSGGKFVYELSPDGYNLYSPGGSGLPRIDLVFRRPSSTTDDEPKPPQ